MWLIQTLLRRDGIFLFAFARRQVAVSIQQVVEAGERLDSSMKNVKKLMKSRICLFTPFAGNV